MNVTLIIHRIAKIYANLIKIVKQNGYLQTKRVFKTIEKRSQSTKPKGNFFGVKLNIMVIIIV